MAESRKKKKGYKCPVCGKVCRTKAGLSSHMRVHKKKKKEKPEEKIEAEVVEKGPAEEEIKEEIKRIERKGISMLGIFSEITEAIVGAVVKAAKIEAEHEIEVHLELAGQLLSKFAIAAALAFVGLFAISGGVEAFIRANWGFPLWQSQLITGILFMIAALYAVKDV